MCVSFSHIVKGSKQFVTWHNKLIVIAKFLALESTNIEHLKEESPMCIGPCIYYEHITVSVHCVLGTKVLYCTEDDRGYSQKPFFSRCRSIEVLSECQYKLGHFYCISATSHMMLSQHQSNKLMLAMC